MPAAPGVAARAPPGLPHRPPGAATRAGAAPGGAVPATWGRRAGRIWGRCAGSAWGHHAGGRRRAGHRRRPRSLPPPRRAALSPPPGSRSRPLHRSPAASDRGRGEDRRGGHAEGGRSGAAVRLWRGPPGRCRRAAWVAAARTPHGQIICIWINLRRPRRGLPIVRASIVGIKLN